MAPVLVTLNDLEGHSPVAGLFKCNPLNILQYFTRFQLTARSSGPSVTAGLLVICSSCRNSYTGQASDQTTWHETSVVRNKEVRLREDLHSQTFQQWIHVHCYSPERRDVFLHHNLHKAWVHLLPVLPQSRFFRWESFALPHQATSQQQDWHQAVISINKTLLFALRDK